MKLDPQEQKKGIIWLLIAGPFAILLTFALYNIDQTLTNSTAEADLGNTLRELRGAQTSLKASELDPRQKIGHSDMQHSAQAGEGLKAVSTSELDKHDATDAAHADH
jgi:hypothetical protein